MRFAVEALAGHASSRRTLEILDRSSRIVFLT
uniref:Uncharacterized protein n=1 Tax=Anguilla anguilla TaxID=7936 RepID=A0A0E9T7L8_ANGAN